MEALGTPLAVAPELQRQCQHHWEASKKHVVIVSQFQQDVAAELEAMGLQTQLEVSGAGQVRQSPLRTCHAPEHYFVVSSACKYMVLSQINLHSPPLCNSRHA